MKKIILIFSLALIASCVTEKKEKKKVEIDIVTSFLEDITSLEKEEDPIQKFKTKAENSANKIVVFDKEKMSSLLIEAKKYKYCVIVIGKHTIVKVKNFNNCTKSGSWGACMPYVEGYIKKGELLPQNDYMNFIIGKPDGQEKTAYLFN